MSAATMLDGAITSSHVGYYSNRPSGLPPLLPTQVSMEARVSEILPKRKSDYIIPLLKTLS